MIYKIKNFLFGWDYIYWNNGIASGIARVMVLTDGKVAYWQYRSSKLMKEIKDPEDVMWLTCHPHKYFPPKMERIDVEKVTDKDIMNELLDKQELFVQRYIEAERFIAELSWYEKIFNFRKVNKFLQSRLEKYYF